MYNIIVKGDMPLERRDEYIAKVTGVFERAGKKFEVFVTEYAGQTKDIAARLTRGGAFAHIVVIGGDGSLHEAINGVENIENCAIGLIPAGTGNDFAESAGIPLDPVSAAEIIAFRAPTHVDFIELDGGLRSINAIGMGIDVEVLKNAYSSKKTTKSKYKSAFLKSLRTYKAATFKASWDGGEEKLYTGIICCLGNGRQIGGGIQLFPEAKIDDGYMDLLVVDYLSRLRTIIAFLKLKAGKVNKVKEVTHVKCKTATFTPIETLPTIQAEGELYDNVKINARVVSDKLKFYLPHYD